MLSRLLPLSRPILLQAGRRAFHNAPILRDSRTPSAFTNILASDSPPPVQVSSITPAGILLADGLILPSACIFLEGKVFLWDVPENLWEGWTKEHFEIFEAVVPKPGEYNFAKFRCHCLTSVYILQKYCCWELGKQCHCRLLLCANT